MGKKKKPDGDSVLGETDSSDTVPSSNAVPSANLCGARTEEYDVWLVRKPTK
ncbi:unnamed protein product, partial [Brugia timori]